VVHGIMRTHMGTVDVQSTPGTGTVFTLYFPAGNDVVVATPVDLPKPKVVHGDGKRVMYVDDDEALVFLVERALTRKGFAVRTFTDPRQAVETLRAHPLDFDLVVTDYNMPGYSGLELLRAVRLIRPDLPVALASGYVTPEIEASALAEGARALIHKPNDVDEMCETLQRLLAGDDAA
jgi:DNA-binding NtrC family response regulator